MIQLQQRHQPGKSKPHLTYLAALAADGCCSGSEISDSESESLSPAKNRDMVVSYLAGGHQIMRYSTTAVPAHGLHSDKETSANVCHARRIQSCWGNAEHRIAKFAKITKLFFVVCGLRLISRICPIFATPFFISTRKRTYVMHMSPNVDPARGHS